MGMEFGNALKKKNKEKPQYAPVSEDIDLTAGQPDVGAQELKVRKTKSYQAAPPEELDEGVLESYEGENDTEVEAAPKKAPQKAPGGPSEQGQVKAYSEHVKATSPVYKANEAAYQKMLKAHKGHLPSAYSAAKKAGNKAASKHFMDLMKKTAAGQVK
jgi:hypothetical protein